MAVLSSIKAIQLNIIPTAVNSNLATSHLAYQTGRYILYYCWDQCHEGAPLIVRGGGVSKGIGQMVCVNWQPHQCQDPGFHAVVDIACKPKQHHILTWKTGISHFYNIKAICHCLHLPVSVTNPKTCQSIHSQESGQAVTGSFSQPNILHDTRACTQIRTAKGQLQNIGLQCYVHSAK